jgi:hypothetical protein
MKFQQLFEKYENDFYGFVFTGKNFDTDKIVNYIQSHDVEDSTVLDTFMELFNQHLDSEDVQTLLDAMEKKSPGFKRLVKQFVKEVDSIEQYSTAIDILNELGIVDYSSEEMETERETDNDDLEQSKVEGLKSYKNRVVGEK